MILPRENGKEGSGFGKTVFSKRSGEDCVAGGFAVDAAVLFFYG